MGEGFSMMNHSVIDPPSPFSISNNRERGTGGEGKNKSNYIISLFNSVSDNSVIMEILFLNVPL